MLQRHSRISPRQGHSSLSTGDTRNEKKLPLSADGLLLAPGSGQKKGGKFRGKMEKGEKSKAKETQPSARIVIEKISLEGITRAWRKDPNQSFPSCLFHGESYEFNKDTRGEFILYFV